MTEQISARGPMSHMGPCDGKRTSPSNPTHSAGENHLTKTFSLRCTDAEKKKLLAAAKAEGISASELLRSALGLIEKPTRKRPIPKADPKLLAAIHSIGVNCNQIARAINSARRAGDIHQLDARQLLSALVSIDRELATLLSIHSMRKDEDAG